MYTILSQGHADNLKALIENYDLDRPEVNFIDFTYGKGSLWKRKKYNLKLIKADADPIPAEDDKDTPAGPIIKLDLTVDDYSGLPLCQGGTFDPPYLFGHQAHDEQQPTSMQKQGKNSWSSNPKFAENKNVDEFINRVKGLNRAAQQCMEPGSLLFVKVMDPRDGKGGLALNHMHVINNLSAFECYAIFVYLAGGAKTWTNHATLSHGYWMVMRKLQAGRQTTL